MQIQNLKAAITQHLHSPVYRILKGGEGEKREFLLNLVYSETGNSNCPPIPE